MGTDKARISPRLSIPVIIDSGRQRATASSPVIIRDPIPVLIETCLGLLVDDSEDLLDGSEPWRDSLSGYIAPAYQKPYIGHSS